jgi:class 3 adenylate cyclase/tetratricopeptide (TPR) repeat protein
MLCPQCHFDNPPAMRFCGQCGSKLSDVSVASDAVTGRISDAPDAERRHVTLMFIDVVNYTSLSEQLDPEVLRDVVLQYQTRSAGVIQRFEGHIGKYLGDGVLVYFGYPSAHEDDARRAVLAAVDIIKEIKLLALELKDTFDIDFAIRIGIHSGIVIAGEMGVAASRERLAVVGDPPNVVARIQALAEPNTIVLSANTYRLTNEHISATSLGEHVLKGVSKSMEVFRVEHLQNVHSHSKLIVEQKQTPLVDRNDELRLLLERWSSTKQNRGGAVLMEGDPGIGKSRLTSALITHLSGQKFECLIGYASPYRRNSDLSPIVELMRSQFAFAEDDPPAQRLEKIEAETVRLDFNLDQTVPMLASLLSLPLSAPYAALDLTAPAYRRELLGLLTRWFLRRASHQPLLLIMEDLHWTDPSTLELLGQLVENCASAPLFLLFTTRKDYQGSLKSHDGVKTISLGPLTEDDSKALIATVSERMSLPSSITSKIANKTDGNPLYIEEVTKMVMASDRLAIPESIQDSLTERLDRLSDGKQIAQTGSVIGRDFRFDLISALSPLSKNELKRGLQKLVDSELLYVTRNNDKVTYTFKHALIQDAAYESMLRTKRQEIHQKVAVLLEGERYAELRTTSPEVLAHHYTEAGVHNAAVRYWQAAGMQSLSRSAGQEAISHLRKALEVVALLDAGQERDTFELDLLIALGGPMTAAQGYSTAEVERTYLRAQELAESLDDEHKLYQCLSGLYRCYVTRAQYARAQEAGEAMRALSVRKPEELGYLLEAERAVGAVLLARGRQHEALEHLENGIRIYDPGMHHQHALLYASDPGLSCMLWSLVPLWLLGYPEKAIKRGDYALELATGFGHAFTLSFAAAFATWVRVFCRDWAGAREYAENAIRICRDRGFLHWLATVTIFHGRALVKCGDPEAGIASLRRGIAGFRTSGAQIALPQLLSQLAESHLELGQCDEGLAVLQDAIATAEQNDEHFWDAELVRLQGDFLLAGKAGEGAIAERYQKAVDLARRQDAKSLELRGLMSLVQLRNDANDREQLRLVYAWFKDQHHYEDHSRARELLR